jgi:hypothetical protein
MKTFRTCIAICLWPAAGLVVIILLIDRQQALGALAAVALAALGSYVYPGSRQETIKSPIARFLVGRFKRLR